MTTLFACGRGLASALDSRLLGSYDGAGAWRIYASEIRSGEEQLYVEMHEGLHHEYQASTGWGLVSAMASELAIRGYRTGPLRSLFERMVTLSRTPHEMFATALSSFAVGEEHAYELLLDNVLYTQYLRRASVLVPRADTPSPRFYHAAVGAVLRAVMSPSSALDVLDVGFARLAADHVPGDNHPEARLAAYEAASRALDWAEVLGSLARQHPGQAGRPWGSPRDPLPDEDTEEFLALRVFEEEVLVPACYRAVQHLLDSAGFPTIAFGRQSELARRVKEAVADVDAELAARLRIVTERRPVADDGLQYDRQQLVLRSPLPAAVHVFTGSIGDRGFLEWDGSSGPTALGVWMTAAAARKQWAFSPGDDEALPVVLAALVQVGTDQASGVPLTVLATLDPVGPRHVQDLLGDATPLVCVTTLSSLADEGLVRTLGSVEPVFVLMDLPVAHQVASWLAQGASVRMAASPLTGTATDLMLLAFRVDQAPAFVFLSINGTGGTSMLIERLRRTHGDALTIDPDVLLEHQAGINLAITKVLATWHVLDQDGTEHR